MQNTLTVTWAGHGSCIYDFSQGKQLHFPLEKNLSSGRKAYILTQLTLNHPLPDR